MDAIQILVTASLMRAMPFSGCFSYRVAMARLFLILLKNRSTGLRSL
jgi:hypothetical protein